jgi:hypothetical protein
VDGEVLFCASCVFIEQFPSGGRTTSSKDPPPSASNPECPLGAHLSSLPLITFQLPRGPERCTPLTFHFRHALSGTSLIRIGVSYNSNNNNNIYAGEPRRVPSCESKPPGGGKPQAGVALQSLCTLQYSRINGRTCQLI